MMGTPIIERTVCVLMVFCAFLLNPAHAADKHSYYDLFTYLFDNSSLPYTKEIRPAMNETHITIVFIDFYLNSIIDVDEKEQTLVTSGTLSMSWSDSFLSWEIEEYGGIADILVPQSIVFRPDVIVGNSVRAAEQLGYPQQQIRLYASGNIIWEPNILLTTSCDIDITYFPFDTQICNIEFETAVSSDSELMLEMAESEDSFNLEAFSPNGQWKLLAVSAELQKAKGYKASVKFGLQLKRRRIFYVLNIVLPVFFLSLTSSLVFALPADAGEKMGTGITILLSFAVYLTIVSDLVPNTSLQVSVIAVYLTSLLGMCAISVVVCTFILRLHFRDEDIPVGPKTTKVTHFLQRLTCSKKDRDVSTNKVVPTDRESTQASLQTKTKSETLTHDNGTTTSIKQVFLDDSKDPITWKDVAKTLDTFCFFLFTFLSVAVTVVCLLILIVGSQMNAPKLKNPKYI